MLDVRCRIWFYICDLTSDIKKLAPGFYLQQVLYLIRFMR